jgi:tetratricopeptide (TPR) repeat protein
MMIKEFAIRLCLPAILLASLALSAPAGRIEAQSPAAQASQSATKILLEKAHTQEARGRRDLAVQTWQQVLLTEPRNPDALANLVRVYRLEGDSKLADSYQARLRALSPNDRSPAGLEHPATAPDQKAQLEQAAKLSDTGNYTDAMAIYRQAFGTHPPAGDWSVAYYETEAATDGGRPHAIQGLRALIEKNPAEARYQISLGRVLTYNPANREEGRKLLAGFPQDTQAALALRQSLLWDAANPAVAPQIRAYLSTHQDSQLAAVFQAAQPASKPVITASAGVTATTPNPAANNSPPAAAPTIAKVTPPPAVEQPSHPMPVPASKPSAAVATAPAAAPPKTIVAVDPTPKPKSIAAPPVPASPPIKASNSFGAAAAIPNRTPTPGTPTEAQTVKTRAADEVAAYQALNANRVADAETRFKAILAGDPASSKALAGMGYVRMQQGNFLGAISFLEQAKRGSPDDKGLLAALETARFWFIMGEGQNSLNSNDLTMAEKRYRTALQLRPTNPEALEGLAGTLLKAQQPAPAISLFERAVEAQPTSVDGWRGLFMAQFQGGDAALALGTARRIPPGPLAQLMSDPLFLQPLASAYAAVGRGAEAQATLESALKQRFPTDVKGLKTDIEVQLAGMLASANHLDQSAVMYKQALADDPGTLAAWQGLVRIQHAMGRDDEALQTVQSIPPATYAAAMRDTGFEIAVASIYQAEKKLDVAQDLLQKAVTEQTNAGQKPSPAIEMQLAGLYIERGSPQLAYPVYQQVIHESPERADAWAGLLSALHVTGHDKEAVAQLKLAPPSVRAQLETNPSYLQTMASVYGALGRSREATQFLGRVEQDYAAQRSAPPLDVEIQNAWLLYNGMDDAGLYRQLMSLGGRHDLSADQRRTVQTIWTNWAARRANQVAAAGNPRRALAILNAAARAFPDNPAAIKSLAIGYAQAGQPHQAVLIYKAQNMASATVSDYEAGVSSALADGDNKDAEVWLRFALKAYPVDPRILILAARFEQARGDTGRAIQYYRASLKAMPPIAPGSKLAADLGLPGPSAPLSLPSRDQPQDISILLAPGYSDPASTGGASPEPYLPSYGGHGPLPPYDGSARLVPPYMTNPGAADHSQSGEEATRTQAVAATGNLATVSQRGQAEVDTAVRSAASRALGQPEVASQQPILPQAPSSKPVTSSPGAVGGEVYSPYVAYVAPPPVPNATQPTGNPSAVVVQLGDNTPHPMQSQTEVTDVLPTARYAPSARANQAAASHAEVSAARADRIRRLQEESAAGRIGQSHPPPEDTITVATQNAEYVTPAQNGAQVPQPPNPPGRQLGKIPDTGAQQYPQPSAPPQPAGPPTITRSRPAPHKPPASPKSAPPATASQTFAQPSPVTQPAPSTPATPVATNVGPVSAGSVQPTGPAYPIATPPTDAQLRAQNLPPLGGYFEAQVPIPMTQRQQAESELASLEGSYSGWLGVTGIGRYRTGASGLDRLFDVEAPAEASAVIRRSVRLTVVALPVFLNSGVLNSSAFITGNVPYIGTLPANSANPTAQQFSNGIGGELQLTTRNVGLAVGYTPYEFLVRNFTGRIRLSGLGNHVVLYGERQSVKDTQLSYAGLHNPGTSFPTLQGPVWGGVISNIGGVRLNFGGANSTFYASGEGGILTGQHVLDNTRFGGTTGADFRVGNWPEHGSLMLGGSLSGMHYAYNESGLSYGQGGYFSPSSYFLASVPISFNGHTRANFHYVIAGSLGVQTFEQDAALFFPLDPSLQSGFVPSNGAICTASQAPSYNCGKYPLTDTTTFNYSFNSQASYRFGAHWYGGGFVFANNARNFNSVSAGFFFRYVFRAQHSPEGYPAGLFTVDGLRPLQIP